MLEDPRSTRGLSEQSTCHRRPAPSGVLACADSLVPCCCDPVWPRATGQCCQRRQRWRQGAVETARRALSSSSRPLRWRHHHPLCRPPSWHLRRQHRALRRHARTHACRAATRTTRRPTKGTRSTAAAPRASRTHPRATALSSTKRGLAGSTVPGPTPRNTARAPPSAP